MSYFCSENTSIPVFARDIAEQAIHKSLCRLWAQTPQMDREQNGPAGRRRSAPTPAGKR
jgi:hypothetical protein